MSLALKNQSSKQASRVDFYFDGGIPLG